MAYFPFFMEIENRPALVVGGGRVALRKIEKLLPFGVEITVVSPAFCKELEGLAGIRRIRRAFVPGDVEGMLFVIGATDDEAVNGEISALCRERRIPVNIVDDPEKCSFFFPALVQRGAFAAGISTGGGSPLAARYMRERLEEIVPAGFDRVVEVLAACREEVKQTVPDSKKREEIFGKIFALALEKAGEATKEEITEILRREAERHG